MYNPHNMHSGFVIYILFKMATDVFIGFELPDTTYQEMEADHDVTLIKVRTTEQVISVVINLVETAPPSSSFAVATPSEINSDNDLSFGPINSNSVLESFDPDQTRLTVSFTIFDDVIPENTEAAQLALEAPTENLGGIPPPRFEILTEFPTFFIIIEDNDGKLSICMSMSVKVLFAYMY